MEAGILAIGVDVGIGVSDRSSVGGGIGSLSTGEEVGTPTSPSCPALEDAALDEASVGDVNGPAKHP